MTESFKTEPRLPDLEQPAVLKKWTEKITIIAKQFLASRGNRLTLDDLIAYGWIGFMEARQGFDPEKKVLFATYASRRIYGAMGDAIRALDPHSRYELDQIKMHNWIILQLGKRNWEVTLENYALLLAQMEADTNKNAHYLTEATTALNKFGYGINSGNHQVISIDEHGEDGEDDRPFLEVIPNPSPLPSETLLRVEAIQRTRDAIAILTDLDKEVVVHHLMGDQHQKDIADRHNFTVSWISLVKKRALYRLRETLEDD